MPAATKTTLVRPTRPYNLIDAINRMTLATGSIRTAIAGSDADYNGHRIEVIKTRHGFTAMYMWGGINRLATGTTFETAVDVADAEYNRGVRGSSVEVECYTQEQIDFCLARGFLFEEENDWHTAQWRDARFDEVAHAIDIDAKFGIGAVGILANSSTVEDYKRDLDAAFAARRAKRSA